MTKAKVYAFNNIHTGEILYLPKKVGKRLNEDWAQIVPAVNEKGEKVLRMQLAGAVVDLQEQVGAPPDVAKENTDVDPKPE